MKKTEKNSGLIRMILVILLLLLLLVLGIYKLLQNQSESGRPEASQESEETAEEEGKTEDNEETEETEEAEEAKTQKEYEAPTYPFKTEEVTVAIRDLTREYTLAWVSDLHLIADQTTSEDILQEDLESVQQRYDSLSVTAEGVHGVELWPEIVKFLNYGHYDGIIFGGDMLDYYSSMNQAAFVEGYQQLNPDVPVLYLRADHDYGAYYGGDAMTEEVSHAGHAQIDGDDPEKKYLNFNDEFMVVGINNSTKNLVGEQMRIVREQLEEGIPVILATHVPFPSELKEQRADMEALSMEIRNKIYYWGGPDYQPNEVTQELLDKIYWEHTPIKQILAGHLHASWDGMLTEKVSEHIFSPAFGGTIGIVHVVPKE